MFGTPMVFLKEFFEKVDFEKKEQMTKKHEKLPSRQRVKTIFFTRRHEWKLILEFKENDKHSGNQSGAKSSPLQKGIVCFFIFHSYSSCI